MRIAKVASALHFRIRHPGRLAWVFSAAMGFAGMRGFIPGPITPFGSADGLIPMVLLAIGLWLAPAAWQWTSEDHSLASLGRGLFQSLIMNGLLLGPFVVLLGLLSGLDGLSSVFHSWSFVFLFCVGVLITSGLGFWVASWEALQPAIVRLAGQSAIGLKLGQELQGAYWEDVQFEGSLVVFHSSYMVGWCAAGAWAPQGHALMVGLGSGAGAVGMLFTHPGLILTVIELSQKVKRMAEVAFPVLKGLQDSGRLNIVVADAAVFLEETDRRYDLGLGDAYRAKNHNECEMTYIPALLEKCDRYWFNCIGTPNWGALPTLVRILQDQGRPVVAAYSPNLGQEPTSANWLLTDCPHEPLRYASVELYENALNEAVARMQATFIKCMSTNLVDLLRPQC